MLKRVLFIFYLCLMNIGANAVPNCPTADGTTQTECEQVVGCEWKLLSGCSYCGTNKYYDSSSTTCKSCPSGHPNSVAGSIGGISDCYKPCETITITGGKRVPSSDKAYYNTQCAYTIQCDNDGGDCDMGFHPDGDNCVPNVQECNGGNGFQFYNDGTFSTCYVSSSSCGSNETLIGRGYSCNGTPYGECMTNGVPCTSKLNTTTCNGDGTISGNATLNNDGTYNLSACECNRNATITNGQAGERCLFNTTTNDFSRDCTYNITSCNSGYCLQNGECKTIPDNYYKNNTNNKDCVQCPAGSFRSGSETDCTWDSRTKFYYGNGGGYFTIPASGKITAK